MSKNSNIWDNDAYGHLIWAYHKGDGDVIEIVERDDGYIDASRFGPASYFSEYKDWSEVNKKAVKHVKGRVLDIGCGAGRFSLHFQQKSHEVVGVDNSPLAVGVCRERGLKDVRELSIYDMDDSMGIFDTVIMMGNNLSLLASPERGRELLERLDKATSDDALLIGESIDIYKTDKKEHLTYQDFNRSRGRMAGHITIRILYKMHKGEWFDYLFFSPEELSEFLEGTPWKIREFIFGAGPVYNVLIEKGIEMKNR